MILMFAVFTGIIAGTKVKIASLNALSQVFCNDVMKENVYLSLYDIIMIERKNVRITSHFK